MSQPAGGVSPARAYAAHLMQRSVYLTGLKGLNAKMMLNYLEAKMETAAKSTSRALKAYGAGEATSVRARHVHQAVMSSDVGARAGERPELMVPLERAVIAEQAEWMPNWKVDMAPRVRQHVERELERAGDDAIGAAQVWVQNSRSPELSRGEHEEFQAAGRLAQAQQVQEQAGAVPQPGTTSRPVEAPAVVTQPGSWVPTGRGPNQPQQQV